MEVNTEAWSVGKYAKRSAIIHLNSDAEVKTELKMAENAITGVSGDGLTITLTNVSPAGGIAQMVLRVVSDTGTEWREIATNGAGSNQLTVALAFTNMANVDLQNAVYEVYDRGFSPGESNVNFNVNIPNYIGYPEHSRCLAQVLSVGTQPHTSIDASNNATADTQTRPMLVGLELEGVPVHNSYTNNLGYNPLDLTPSSGVNTSQLISVFPLQKFNATRHYTSSRSILDDGVLIGSPFGKRIRVRLKNMTTNADVVMRPREDNGDGDNEIKNNPVHIVLRLLFIDDDEIPDR